MAWRRWRGVSIGCMLVAARTWQQMMASAAARLAARLGGGVNIFGVVKYKWRSSGVA